MFKKLSKKLQLNKTKRQKLKQEKAQQRLIDFYERNLN